MSTGISAISFAELEGFLEDLRWKDARILPITRERALSQKYNPHAADVETCLWIAEDEQGELIGFAGALPAGDPSGDPANAPSGAKGMAWNSCWWVDPEKGKEAAMPLLLHFLSRWDQRVAFSDMTERTHAIIGQLGFCHTREEELQQHYVRVPLRKLFRDTGVAGKLLSPLILCAGFLLNLVWNQRIRRAVAMDPAPHSELHPDLHWKLKQDLDEETWEFIASHREQDFSRRSREEFDWIFKAGWLVDEDPASAAVADRYPFSYVARYFEMYWLVTRKGGEISSVQLLSLRDGVLKVLYYFGREADHALKALTGVVARDGRIYSLILAHPALLSALGSQWKISLRRRMRIRRTGISRKLMDAWPRDLHMQLGDGDASFT